MLLLRTMDRERIDRLGTLTAHGAGPFDACAIRAERQLKAGMNQSADVLRAWLR